MYLTARTNHDRRKRGKEGTEYREMFSVSCQADGTQKPIGEGVPKQYIKQINCQNGRFFRFSVVNGGDFLKGRLRLINFNISIPESF